MILMKDITAKQSIWDSPGEVSTTNIYYKSIQLKMVKPTADCSALLLLADSRWAGLRCNHVIDVIQ